MIWIFLRGLAREARHWGDFPDRFHAGLGEPACERLTLDLPGNGRRCHEPSPSNIEAMMEACRSELQRLGKAPPYHLLAYSLGGMVALAWAARYPAECRVAILLGTSLRPHHPFHWRLRPHAWPTLLRLALGGARETAILQLTSARAAELQPLLPQWNAWARECPVSRLNVWRQLKAAAHFSMPEKPAVPLLLLAGKNDRMVDPRCTQTLTYAWGVDCVLHPRAGHDLVLDDPDWVVQQVAAWLPRFTKETGSVYCADVPGFHPSA